MSEHYTTAKEYDDAIIAKQKILDEKKAAFDILDEKKKKVEVKTETEVNNNEEEKKAEEERIKKENFDKEFAELVANHFKLEKAYEIKLAKYEELKKKIEAKKNKEATLIEEVIPIAEEDDVETGGDELEEEEIPIVGEEAEENDQKQENPEEETKNESLEEKIADIEKRRQEELNETTKNWKKNSFSEEILEQFLKIVNNKYDKELEDLKIEDIEKRKQKELDYINFVYEDSKDKNKGYMAISLITKKYDKELEDIKRAEIEKRKEEEIKAFRESADYLPMGAHKRDAKFKEIDAKYNEELKSLKKGEKNETIEKPKNNESTQEKIDKEIINNLTEEDYVKAKRNLTEFGINRARGEAKQNVTEEVKQMAQLSFDYLDGKISLQEYLHTSPYTYRKGMAEPDLLEYAKEESKYFEELREEKNKQSK